MRFLVDAQLPPSLAATLCEYGHEAVHVSQVLPRNARDPAIWTSALREGFVIVTKDEDFAAWSRLRTPAPPVLWIRLGNLRKAELRAKLAPLLPSLLQRLEAGESLVEVI